PSENTVASSNSMCAVVKGYPFVVQNSDSPQKQWNIAYDAPLFHWYSKKDRDRQLVSYMKEEFGIERDQVETAIGAADEAMAQFKGNLKKAAQEILDRVRSEGKFSVVLASRPYQNDSLVNHNLPDLFTSQGIPVLTV